MKKFKVHMMYKDCKEVKAKTMEEHLKLKKKGYNHKKSKDCETKDGDSFNPKLKKAVTDGKIKGKFAEKVMASDGASLSSKRAQKKIDRGQTHKKMSVDQKKEAMKNKRERFDPQLGVKEGTPMKKKK